MRELKDNYQDDVLDSEKNQLRKYNMIHNDDGTVSFVDATVYSQNGDNFGAKDVNDIVARIGEVSKAENIDYDGEKSVKGAIDECVRTLGYTVTSKNYLPNNSVSTGIFTVNNDKTVTVNGKGTIDPWTNIYFMGNYVNNDYKEIKGLEDGVDYIYSCCPSGASGDTYQGHLFVVDENNNISTLRDNGEGVTFTHHKGNKYSVSAGVKYNYQATNILLKPMISKEGGEYEPYVEDVQTQINGMNGRILSIKQKVITTTSDANGNVFLVLIDEYPNLINVRCSSHMTSAIGVIVTQANAMWGCRLVTNSPSYAPLANTNVTLVMRYLE